MALIFAASIVAGLAALDDGSALAGQRTFVGAAKCKTCHKKPENGEQFKIWSESAHAKAYETLASEAAKKIAADKGIADPQKADECLSCHVTGHGVAAEFLGKKYAVTDGVGCESCHGAGGDYYKKKTMIAIAGGEIDRATVGLVKPDEKVCTGCHNDKSPTFESFDFAAMSKKIAHPIPEGAERTGAGGDDEEE
ncbi:MAG: multiheme c-type cytochrome [Gemmatimonadota bacterium]|nr:multiheme c-type cytochrome [Gemmatimonadota bacterium]